MDSLLQLRTFLAVARCSSFAEAARQLHVVASVAAKRVAQLEARLGTRLFERTTRRVALTDAGHALQRRIAPLVAEIDGVMSEVRRDEGRLEGHLRLMAPTSFTIARLAPLLDAFLAEHERITLEVSLVDRSTSPVESGHDIAISGRSASYEGVVETPLCPARPRLCASPRYLEQAPALDHPRELADHRCLAFRPAGTLWAFQTARGTVHVEVQPRITTDDNHTLLRFAESGQGVAILPDYLCGGSIRSGRLVPLLPAFAPQDGWFKAYVPRRRQSAARVRALLAWLVLHLQQ